MHHLRYVILITLLLGTFFSANAQKKKHKKEKRNYPLSYYSFGAGYERSLLFLNKNYLLYGIFDENVGFRGGNAMAFAAHYGKSINKRYDIAVGLSHDRQQVVQTKGFDYIPCDPTRYRATSIVKAERWIKMNRVEIPIDVRARLYMRKLAFTPSFGLGLSFYNARNQQVKMTLNNGEIGENAVNDDLMQQTRGFNISALLKLGFLYELGTKTAIKIEPFYKHYLIKEPILAQYKKVNPFGIGIMFGIEQTLNMAPPKDKKKKKS